MKIPTLIFYALLGVSIVLGHSADQNVNAPRPSQSDDQAVERQIIEIERQWSQAFIKHDPTVFERHVADDYVGVYPTRKITKGDLIAETKGGGNRTIMSAD